MKNKYTIPGYFEDCVISGDEIREDRLFGTVLFRYDNHTLKEPGFFGSTVLVFKNGGIYKPGFFGERLFRVSDNGEVREDRLFGKNVGVIPPEWMDGFASEVQTVYTATSTSAVDFAEPQEQEESLQAMEEHADMECGWCADYSNVKVGAATISCPKKYHSITAIAPALAKNGLRNVKIHSEVSYIKTQNVHGYYFMVDPENQRYCSEDGVLYNKSKTALLSFPRGKEADGFRIPSTVKMIGTWAFGFSSVENVIIPDGVEEIGDSAFEFCKKLRSIYIPESVKKIARNAFYECKRVVLTTSLCEKPSSWELDTDSLKGICWNQNAE